MSGTDADIEEMIRLVGTIYRLHGLLRTHILADFAELKLARLDALTLATVVRHPEMLTVAQIGRLSGFSRQSIQRSARSLAAARLIEFIPNPQHIRSPLLVATTQGVRKEELAEQKTRALAAALRQEYPAERTGQMADQLSGLLNDILAATGSAV